MSLLSPYDKVGIIAPSSNLSGQDLTPFIELLKSWSIESILADNLESSYRYMAGDDSFRASSLNKMLEDKKIKVLFCLRGGAGATRILPYINYQALQSYPKTIVGLSDSTALQNAVYAITGNSALTGFLPLYDTHNNRIDDKMAAELHRALFDDKRCISSGAALITGEAQGEIVGGCLSVLTQLCGTPYFPNLKNKILLLEDVGEKTYKIDLMLTQLKNQPDFKQLGGIIFGVFNNCPIKDEIDGTIDDCLRDFTKGLTIPVIKDFAYGHIPERYILPIGKKVIVRSQKDNCVLEYDC